MPRYLVTLSIEVEADDEDQALRDGCGYYTYDNHQVEQVNG